MAAWPPQWGPRGGGRYSAPRLGMGSHGERSAGGHPARRPPNRPACAPGRLPGHPAEASCSLVEHQEAQDAVARAEPLLHIIATACWTASLGDLISGARRPGKHPPALVAPVSHAAAGVLQVDAQATLSPGGQHRVVLPLGPWPIPLLRTPSCRITRRSIRDTNRECRRRGASTALLSAGRDPP